jgi:DNA-binding IscR family transcriptional regulator
MEGGIVLNRCVDTPKACPLTETCPVQKAWSDATRGLEDQLASITFDQLATGLERRVTNEGYRNLPLLDSSSDSRLFKE